MALDISDDSRKKAMTQNLSFTTDIVATLSDIVATVHSRKNSVEFTQPDRYQ